MKPLSPSTPPAPARDPGKLADFILYAQQEFLLGLSKELSRANISFSQFYLLGYLTTLRKPSMTDIARKMGHSTAAATGLVDRLEYLTLVERSHDTDDRRKVMVSITAKGIELVSSLRSALQARVAEAMSEKESRSFIDEILGGEK